LNWIDVFLGIGNLELLLVGFVAEIFSSNLSERFAKDDLTDGFLDAPPPCPLALEDFAEDRFIGELDGSPQSVTEEFTIKLPDEVLLAMDFEVASQVIEILDLLASRKLGRGIDRFTRCIEFTESSDGIVVFKSIAVRIDALVAFGTSRIARMPLGQFPFGDSFGGQLCENRYILRWLGQFLPEDDFA
jgi:hypothetical protein